jgi:hypothetical protein
MSYFPLSCHCILLRGLINCVRLAATSGTKTKRQRFGVAQREVHTLATDWVYLMGDIPD